jgi:hypothetical protein
VNHVPKYGDSSDVVDRTEGSRAEATRPPTEYKAKRVSHRRVASGIQTQELARLDEHGGSDRRIVAQHAPFGTQVALTLRVPGVNNQTTYPYNA